MNDNKSKRVEIAPETKDEVDRRNASEKELIQHAITIAATNPDMGAHAAVKLARSVMETVTSIRQIPLGKTRQKQFDSADWPVDFHKLVGILSTEGTAPNKDAMFGKFIVWQQTNTERIAIEIKTHNQFRAQERFNKLHGFDYDEKLEAEFLKLVKEQVDNVMLNPATEELISQRVEDVHNDYRKRTFTETDFWGLARDWMTCFRWKSL